MKRRYIPYLIFSLCILFIVGGIAINKFYHNPNKEFMRIFNFELPSSVEINKYEYHSHLFEENEFYLKAHLNENDYITIEKELSNSSLPELMKIKKEEFPNIQNVCSWWDMNKDEVILAYEAFQFGKVSKTKMLYLFITKNSNAEYYMYISN